MGKNYEFSRLKCLHTEIQLVSALTERVNLSVCVHRYSLFEASRPKRRMNMNEKEGGVLEGGLNVTLTIRLLMHGKVRHISNPQSCTCLFSVLYFASASSQAHEKDLEMYR